MNVTPVPPTGASARPAASERLLLGAFVLIMLYALT